MSSPRVLVPFAAQTYLDALVAAGLEPVLLADGDVAGASTALEGLAGLMFTGGEGGDPALFGEAPHPKATPPNSARDAVEVMLARAARAQRLPTLALCRGVHIMNVALGGSLIQDIPSQWPGGTSHPRSRHAAERVHRV